MKSKFSLGWRVLVTIALVASLGLVFAAPQEASAAVGELDVEVNAFYEDGGGGDKVPLCHWVDDSPWEWVCECVPTDEQFYINATVTAIGAEVSGVQATIAIEGPAILDPLESATKIVGCQEPGVVPACAAQDVWWKLDCTGPGLVYITVTATGAGVDPASDTLEVEQCPDDTLITVRIIEPECGVDSVCDGDPMVVQTSQVFGVKAKVRVAQCQDSGTAVEDVVATISWEGYGPNPGAVELVQGMPDHWDVGTVVGPGDAHEVGWMLHCTQAGAVKITVDADFPDEEYGDVNNDFVIVEQMDPPCLDLTVITPSDGAKICTGGDTCGHFDVQATLCNYCDALLENVSATLEVIDGAGTVNIVSDEQQFGLDLESRADCESYDCWTVTWDVICTGEGEVNFKITGRGRNEDTLEQLKDEELVSVVQQECVVSLSASDTTVSTEQCFVVTANPRNCTGGIESNVPVTIEWSPVEAAHLAVVDECPSNGCNQCVEEDPCGGTMEPGCIWPNDATKYFNNVCNCCTCEAKWCLVCDDDGPLTITVTSGLGDGCSETITVNQELKAHLVAGLDTYYQCEPDHLMTPTDAFRWDPNPDDIDDPQPADGEGQCFHVVVPVFNTGEADAYDVFVEVSLTGDAEFDGNGKTEDTTIPYIAGGEVVKAIWEVCCTGYENVTISVTDFYGYDCNTECEIPEANICPPCPIDIKQVPVDIEWIEPEKTGSCCDLEIEPCTYFTVKAKITNQDIDDILTGVSAMLYWGEDDPVELAEGQPNPVPLENLLPGEWAEATWQMHCADIGEVEFMMVVNTTDPEMCMEDEGPRVCQGVPPTCLEIDIISPDMGSFYATSQEFAITAEIKNRGIQCVDCPVPFYASFEAWNVVVGLADLGYDIDMGPHFFEDGLGHIDVLDCNYPEADETGPNGEPLWDIGNIPAGESAMVTWTVHCDSSGLTAIAAEVDWDNFDVECVHPGFPPKVPEQYEWFLTGLQYLFDIHDLLLLWQYPTAHLEVEITEVVPDTTINVCDEFEVHYTVTNTGEADASQVEAILSVTPEGTARPAAGYDKGYTVDIGTLAGHGQDGTYEGVWNMHCKDACESTINITADGLDEYGWHKKQQCASTGNFFVEGGCLVVEGLDHLRFDGPIPGRGWTYGVFVGDANGLTGPFSMNTPMSWAFTGGGPDIMGQMVVQGYVIPHVGTFESWLIEWLCGDCDSLLTLLGDVEGEDIMLFVGHWVLEEDMPGGWFWEPMCVGGGLIEVINGTITGGEFLYEMGDSSSGVLSFLGGTYCSSMAAEAGMPIDPRFIEDAWVTVKQLPSAGVDLGVIKVVDNPNPEQYEDVVYTIMVTNYGPGEATGVKVIDNLWCGPVTYVGDVATQGTYDDGTWTVGNLTVGASASLMLTAEVQSLDEYVNTATVTCDQPDGNPLNDEDTAVINPSLAIQLEEGWNFVSWPLIPGSGLPGDANIEPEGTGVLKDLAVPDLTTNMDVVWGEYDPVIGYMSWKTYNPDFLTNTLTEMWDGVGFWIDMETAGLAIVIEGQEQPDPPATPRVYNVVGGDGGYWNVIAFKSTTAKSPDDYLAGITDQYTIIYGFDNGAYFVVGTPGHPNLEPGLAYWIAVLKSGNIFP